MGRTSCVLAISASFIPNKTRCMFFSFPMQVIMKTKRKKLAHMVHSSEVPKGNRFRVLWGSARMYH